MKRGPFTTWMKQPISKSPGGAKTTRYLYSAKMSIFSRKFLIFFLFLLKNIDCGYTLNLDRPPLNPILYSKIWVYNIHYFSYFNNKTYNILIRTASLMQLYQVPTIYVLSNNKKNHILHSFDNCNLSPKYHSTLNWYTVITMLYSYCF